MNLVYDDLHVSPATLGSKLCNNLNNLNYLQKLTLTLIFPYLETQLNKIIQDELRRSPPAAAWMLQLYVHSPPSILPLIHHTIFATRTKPQRYASIRWNYCRSDLYFISISQSIGPKPSSGANVPEQPKRSLTLHVLTNMKHY